MTTSQLKPQQLIHKLLEERFKTECGFFKWTDNLFHYETLSKYKTVTSPYNPNHSILYEYATLYHNGKIILQDFAELSVKIIDKDGNPIDLRNNFNGYDLLDKNLMNKKEVPTEYLIQKHSQYNSTLAICNLEYKNISQEELNIQEKMTQNQWTWNTWETTTNKPIFYIHKHSHNPCAHKLNHTCHYCNYTKENPIVNNVYQYP